VVLDVQDDGRGIRPEAVGDARSLGLLGMRERATVLGGEIAIGPAIPRGSRVTLRLPRTADTAHILAEA
jgi:signal transduction histidine kinase